MVKLGIILLPILFLLPVATAAGLLLVAAALAGSTDDGNSGRPGFEEDEDEFEAFSEASEGDRTTGER